MTRRYGERCGWGDGEWEKGKERGTRQKDAERKRKRKTGTDAAREPERERKIEIRNPEIVSKAAYCILDWFMLEDVIMAYVNDIVSNKLTKDIAIINIYH